MADKVLKLTFEDAEGKRRSLVINNPKENLTEDQTRKAMRKIVSARLFVKDGVQKFYKIMGAKYYSSQSDQIFTDKDGEIVAAPNTNPAADTKPANAQ